MGEKDMLLSWSHCGCLQFNPAQSSWAAVQLTLPESQVEGTMITGSNPSLGGKVPMGSHSLLFLHSHRHQCQWDFHTNPSTQPYWKEVQAQKAGNTAELWWGEQDDSQQWLQSWVRMPRGRTKGCAMYLMFKVKTYINHWVKKALSSLSHELWYQCNELKSFLSF
jgi:hypothetical protein